MKHISNSYKNFLKINGRTSRGEFWTTYLFNYFIIVVLTFVGGETLATTVPLLVFLILVAPIHIGIGIRRMHDVNKSGWFLLLPLINLVYLCFPSVDEGNRWGEKSNIKTPSAIQSKKSIEKNSQSSNKNFIIGGAVLLVIGLAVAIGVTLSSEPVAAPLPEGETTINGENLPQYAGENDDSIAVGLPGPIFSGPNENSEIVSLKKNGNAKAILFLAHWCPHCQKELPAVQQIIDTIGVPDGVDVIAIATSIDRGRDNYPPQDWLFREGWTETQIYDLDKDISRAYGLTSFPYWVFLDKDLNVIARRAGNLPGDYIGQLLIQLANQ